jgi:hypothetical protein
MSKIAVTTFYSESYEPLAALTIPPLQQWCDRHGYDLHIHKIENNESFHFVKTKDARKLLDEYDVVMAIENDILITNLNYRIEDWLDDEHSFFICKDVNNYNGGCFIIKSNGWAKDFLRFVQSHAHWKGDEQNVFEEWCGRSFYQRDVKTMCHPSINSIPYEYYAPSYGYINWEQYNPRKEKPTHEQGCWEKGDWCCHLPGKTLSERIEIFNKIKEDIIYE